MHIELTGYRDKVVTETLIRHAAGFHAVVGIDLNADNVTRLDFTENNPLLVPQDLLDTAIFNNTVNKMLREKNALFGIGGYMENRVIYRRSYRFDHLNESRSIHLGIDIWAPEGVPVFAPIAGKLHSCHDNEGFGDYGPTIILEHELDGEIFFTLYGHLSRKSLEGLTKPKTFAKGEKLGEIGPFPENGDWPPHLHFQVMTDMQGMKGDFPGVCKPSEKEAYQHLCLDPNYFLQCRHLR